MADHNGSITENYLSCPGSLSDYSMVKINVSGKKYQTYESTLRRFPNTLLGSADTREPFFDSAKGEYFFDRHRSCFTSILYYYQSEGTLLRPLNLSPDIFFQECCFFGIGEEAQKILGFDEMEVNGTCIYTKLIKLKDFRGLSGNWDVNPLSHIVFK